MFFIFSKILAFVITPMVWVIVLLLIALLSKKARRKRRALISAIIIFLVFSNSFIVDEMMRAWELPAKKTRELTGVYDAGIVLGGMLTYDREYDRVNFSRATDRILQALELYKKGKIKKIFISGGQGTLVDYGYTEAAVLKDYLLMLGIPEEDIWIETESKNTRQNALQTKAVLTSRIPDGKYLLITSAFHMRRAKGCFEKVHLNVDSYSTDRYSGSRKFHLDHLLQPNVSALGTSTLLIHEITGYLVYKLAGYV